MTFTVQIENELVRQIDIAAKETGETRSALIQQALREWLGHKRAAWPAKVMAFKGIRGAPRFENERSELKLPPEPFDAISA